MASSRQGDLFGNDQADPSSEDHETPEYHADPDEGVAVVELYGPHQRGGGFLRQFWRKLRLRDSSHKSIWTTRSSTRPYPALSAIATSASVSSSRRAHPCSTSFLSMPFGSSRTSRKPRSDTSNPANGSASRSTAIRIKHSKASLIASPRAADPHSASFRSTTRPETSFASFNACP